MRQYIGARYVPKFEGTWANDRTYEALCVVDYNGDSYTSKKPVPVGVAPTNNTYWALTGAYNSQISNLADRITALSDHVDDLLNLNMIIIGDSYGVADPDSDITKFYWEYVRDYLGLTQGVNFRAAFESGGGFGNTEFYRKLKSIGDTMTDDEKNAVNKIVVCGGWNDVKSTADYQTDAAFYAGVTTFVTYAKANFPNAELMIGHISWGGGSLDGRNYIMEAHEKLPTSLFRYTKLGEYGFKYITNSEYILHRYDGLWAVNQPAHPNALGQAYLGVYLANGVVNGSVDIISDRHEIGFNAVADIVNHGFSLVEMLNNNVVTLSNSDVDGYIELTGGQSFNTGGRTPYQIFDIATYFCRPGLEGSDTVVPCEFKMADDSRKFGTVNLRFYDNKVYAYFTIDGTNLSPAYIFIGAFSLNMNTLFA